MKTTDIEKHFRKLLEKSLRAHTVKSTRIDDDSLLNPANDDAVTEEISFDSMIASITLPNYWNMKEDDEETEVDGVIYGVKKN